jgi:hypothetical protein
MRSLNSQAGSSTDGRIYMFHGEQPQHADMTLLEEILKSATDRGVKFVSLQVSR